MVDNQNRGHIESYLTCYSDNFVIVDTFLKKIKLAPKKIFDLAKML